jgi:hypothetical protein
MRAPTLLLALLAVPAAADDEYTLYELLAPETHRFAITYDVTTSTEGARLFFNPIRPGSTATDERVIDRATGRDLRFSIVKGREAKATGLVEPDTADDALFIRVELASPVPKGGERRLRILKTYADPKSYFTEGDRIVFARGLGIPNNAVVLPKGYELVACSVPAIVSTEADGRMKASFANDRADELGVRIVGRRLPTGDGQRTTTGDAR